MDEAELKALEKDIDDRVGKLLLDVQNLEWQINQQTDTVQRHTDQRYIHEIVTSLNYLLSDREEYKNRRPRFINGG